MVAGNIPAAKVVKLWLIDGIVKSLGLEFPEELFVLFVLLVIAVLFVLFVLFVVAELMVFVFVFVNEVEEKFE